MTGLRRSLHFIPSANARMLEKAADLPADALILDLEDAVTPDRKQQARDAIRQWLDVVDCGHREVIVRANPLDTPWGHADLETLLAGRPPAALLVPKVRSANDLNRLHERLQTLEQTNGHMAGVIELIVIATETPQGALAIPELAQAPRVSALTWGAEDLSAALSARCNRDASGRYLPVFEYCRSLTLLSATAAGIAPIDGIHADFRNLGDLRRECQESADMGFSGKLTIHPDQIEIINAAFSPSEQEAARARELLEAFAENQRAGRMVFAFRGAMVDTPHLKRARRILARASAIAAAETNA